MEDFGSNFFPITIVEPAASFTGVLLQTLVLLAIRFAQVLGYTFAITLGVLLAFRVLG